MLRPPPHRPCGGFATKAGSPSILLLSTAVLVGLLSAGVGVSAFPSGAILSNDGPARAQPPGSGEISSAVQTSATITLSAPGVTAGAVSLSWTATTDRFFSNYTIAYSATSASGPFRTAGVVTTQTTTVFAVGSLSPGANLWWQVTEYSPFGVQATSNVLAVVQPTLAYLTESMVTSSSITFDWTNNASYGGQLSFQSYGLYERINGGSSVLAATVTDESTLNTTVTGLATGTSYSFYLSTTDCIGCTSGSPSSSTTSSNTVTAGTLLALAVTISASHPVVDVNQSDLFTCTPSGGQSPFTFEWSVGGSGLVAGNSSFATTFASGPQNTMMCQVTDSDGHQAAIAMSVTVNPDPTISLSVNRTTVQPGESISFTCTVTGGTPNVGVGMSFGDGSSEFAENGGAITHSYSATGTFVSTCTATDSVGVSVASSTTVTVSSAAASTSSSSLPIGLLVLILGTAVGAGIALGVWKRRRDLRETGPQVMSRWVPPLGPKQAMQAAKICPSCGAPNAPSHRTCDVCGANLPRT